MKLQILSVRDCPNLDTLRRRLADLLAGRPDISITAELIDTPEQAAEAGMNGSPTLLIDGTDPFAQPDQTPSLSCRLYRDDNGDPSGAPSMSQLRHALGGPRTVLSTRAAGEGLRIWRARTAPKDPQARAVHREILRAFATTGRPPSPAAVRQIAWHTGAASADAILAQLHEADVIRLDLAGAVGVAYPFSTVPTRHRVRLASGVEVSAMCVVDALGIPAMLNTDATITSTDPVTDQPVTVCVDNQQYVWDPTTAVVFYSAAAGTGPSADACCNDLNAFTSPASAQTWMQAHPHIPGELLDTTTAERLGRHVFAALLTPADS